MEFKASEFGTAYARGQKWKAIAYTTLTRLSSYMQTSYCILFLVICILGKDNSAIDTT